MTMPTYPLIEVLEVKKKEGGKAGKSRQGKTRSP